MDAETWDRIGSLPRTHGLLGALLKEPEVIRRADIRADPRFRYYPQAHPDMRSFLGVPIMAGGEVVAALYLAEKVGGDTFTEADQRLVETLAGHAALAVVNAQRQERLRELSIVDERTRIARDLHDSVTKPCSASPSPRSPRQPWQVPAPRRTPIWTGCGSCRGPRWTS